MPRPHVPAIDLSNDPRSLLAIEDDIRSISHDLDDDEDDIDFDADDRHCGVRDEFDPEPA